VEGGWWGIGGSAGGGSADGGARSVGLAAANACPGSSPCRAHSAALIAPTLVAGPGCPALLRAFTGCLHWLSVVERGAPLARGLELLLVAHPPDKH